MLQVGWGQHYHHKTPLFLACTKWPDCRGDSEFAGVRLDKERNLRQPAQSAAQQFKSTLQCQRRKRVRASGNCFPFEYFTLILLKTMAEPMGRWPPEHGSELPEMPKNKFPALCLILSKLGMKQSLWSCCASQVLSIKR